jgi:hypothetical protein
VLLNWLSYHVYTDTANECSSIGDTTVCSKPLADIDLDLGRSSSTDHSLAGHRLKTHKATVLLDSLLQGNHPLLVTSGVLRVLLEAPSQVLVGVVGSEALIQYTKPLAVTRNLLPVTLDILKVGAEVCEATLEDLAVCRRVHGRLEVAELLPCLVWLSEHKIRSALARTHECANLLGVLLDEGVVADVEDAAEAAAAELSELIDTQHLDFIAVAALGHKPLLELNHLYVLESDTGVDLAGDDAACDVHANTNGRVVLRRHAVVRSQLVKLDLSELANVADLLSLERGKVGCDAGGGQVNDTSEGLVEEGADGLDWEITSGGSERMDHGLEAEIDLAGTDDLGDILCTSVSDTDIIG